MYKCCVPKILYSGNYGYVTNKCYINLVTEEREVHFPMYPHYFDLYHEMVFRGKKRNKEIPAMTPSFKTISFAVIFVRPFVIAQSQCLW